MEEFKEGGCNANISELNDNLIGMTAVKILDKKQIIEDALNYLMFLKMKRSETEKSKRVWWWEIAVEIPFERRIKLSYCINVRFVHIMRYRYY